MKSPHILSHPLIIIIYANSKIKFLKILWKKHKNANKIVTTLLR
jgi:hypothetical protein